MIPTKVLHKIIEDKNTYKKNKLITEKKYQDFDYKVYKFLNVDLPDHFNENDCINHFLTIGKFENRIYKMEIPDDFDWNIYKSMNVDLPDHFNENDCKKHFLLYGKNENRVYTKTQSNEKKILIFNNAYILYSITIFVCLFKLFTKNLVNNLNFELYHYFLNSILDTKLDSILDTKLDYILNYKLDNLLDSRLNNLLDSRLNTISEKYSNILNAPTEIIENNAKVDKLTTNNMHSSNNKIIHITHNFGGGTQVYIDNLISVLSSYKNVVIKILDEQFITFEDTKILTEHFLNTIKPNDLIIVHHLLYTSENGHILNLKIIDDISKIKAKKIFIAHDYHLLLPKTPNPVKSKNIIPTKNHIQNCEKIFMVFNKVYFNSINCYTNYKKYVKLENYMILSNVPDINYYNKRIFPPKKVIYNIGVIGEVGNEHKGRFLLNNILNLFNKTPELSSHKFHIFGEYDIKYDNLVVHGKYVNNNIFNLIKNNNIDLFLFVSTFEETYSFTLSIAIHTGLPIIYNNIGAYTERLENYSNCFPFDEQNYSNIMGSVLNKIHTNSFFNTSYNEYKYPSLCNNLPEFSNFFKTTSDELNFNINNYIFKHKAVCFLHICNLDDYKGYDIFLDQLKYIKSSGLYDNLDYIFVTMLGNYKNLTCDYKVKLIYYSKNINEWEFPNMKRIYYFSKNVNENIKILQIHTKGVLNKPYSTEWRKYLEYFLIEKYDLCINNLNNYNCIGVNQQFYFDKENKYRNHFSGNFWWTKSDYVKRLPPIDFNTDRYITEHWLIGNLELNDYRYNLSLHHSEIDFYKRTLLPSQFNIEMIKDKICKQLENKYTKTKPIYGIYFICCIGEYMKIIKKQIQKIMYSGLYDVSDKILCFVCNVKKECTDLLSKYDKFVVISTKLNLYEKFAINNFKTYINGDYYLYYIHSKSVTRTEQCYIDWLNFCDYFIIQKWRLSLELLNYYDCVGFNLKNFPKKHFSGNFWWSKSEHINKLNNINDGYLSSEMYILSYVKTNYVSIYQSYVNHGDTNYPSELYINKSDSELINNISIIPDFNSGDKGCISMCGEIDLSREPPILELV